MKHRQQHGIGDAILALAFLAFPIGCVVFVVVSVAAFAYRVLA